MRILGKKRLIFVWNIKKASQTPTEPGFVLIGKKERNASIQQQKRITLQINLQ